MDLEGSSLQDFSYDLPDGKRWFPESRYGVFIHWGPYAAVGRGEQALFRDHMDQEKYAQLACQWNPEAYDPRVWAKQFKEAGFRYACLTTRHHDGYCLWRTDTTNYSSAAQAPKRDFVAEFCEAMRSEGIRVGLYYSWCDWRVPAYYEGPDLNPSGWSAMRRYIHAQVEELCTRYGTIDYFFFDGVWPRCAEDLGSRELISKMRTWQPNILINNRLGFVTDPKQLLAQGGGNEEGDFSTPERQITAAARLWEANLVSNWRWWGYHAGERWRTAEELLDSLCTCASLGGNLILNVGPQADGRLPAAFVEATAQIGRWLTRNGDAIFGNDGGSMTEALTYGYQTIHNNTLYLILRFWDRKPTFVLPDLTSEVTQVRCLSDGQSLPFEKHGDTLTIAMPASFEEPMFPVLAITCASRPATNAWGRQRLWEGDPLRIAAWARTRWDRTGFDV